MKKKISFSVIILFILALLCLITNYIDGGRVSTGHEPKFCIKVVNDDKVTYWGLGYKVIRYVNDSPDEPYKNNIGVKMGNWFMKYELTIDNPKNEHKKGQINTLDDFYNTEVTKNLDIRNLGLSYGISDARKDNCLIVGTDIKNNYLYKAFMEDVKNEKTSFIRIATTTIEGDLILVDILYYKESNMFYLVVDNSRDEFIDEKLKNLVIKEFKNIGEYNYDNHNYWVLYNDEITNDNFNTDAVFKILAIN